MTKAKKPRKRRLPGVPLWVENCLRVPPFVVGKLLSFLDYRVCKAAGQIVVCVLLAFALPVVFLRRPWRTALLGRMGRRDARPPSGCG
jgi:hypothetical protein